MKGTKCKRPYGHLGECNPKQNAIPYQAEHKVLMAALEWRELWLRGRDTLKHFAGRPRSLGVKIDRAMDTLGDAIDAFNLARDDARLIIENDRAMYRKRRKAARKGVRTRRMRAAAARDRYDE